MSCLFWKESDFGCVVMLFDFDLKVGVYFYFGDRGINGMFVSKLLYYKFFEVF